MVTPYVYTTNCINWCTDQFYHASTEYVFLVFLAGLALAGFFVFSTVWDRLDNKPFSDEVAEKIVNGLLTLALVLIIMFLAYHYFVNEPANTSEMLKNFTELVGDNPLNELKVVLNG